MTPVYDPFHPLYLDEADLRVELARATTICGSCRACISRCDVFPRLFTLLDRADPAPATAEEQDHAVGACFDCGLCVVGCPSGPGLANDPLDMARLMARARHVGVSDDSRPAGRRLVSTVRRVTASVSAPFGTRTRFSSWFRQRTDLPVGNESGPVVALFPTCHVEHHQPEVGQALVAVYERVGVGCSLPEGLQCCGAPQLDAGDLEAFVALGRRNVRRLAEAVRAGQEIVVPQPTCVSVLRHSYPAFVGGSDAELVAEHTHDACAHLIDLLEPSEERSPEAFARTALGVSDAGSVTVHAPCRQRSQQQGVPAAELLSLLGFDVEVVTGCASPDPRVPSDAVAATLDAIRSAELVVGDCPSSGGVMASRGGREVVHPLQLLARALGLASH